MIKKNNANVRKIEAMGPELKEAYLCSATRVTIGKVEQVVQKDGRNVFKTSYVAKIRGVIVGDEGEYLHETPNAAMEYGREVLEKWRSEFLAKHNGNGSTHTICGREVTITDMKNGKFVYETDRDESGYVTADDLNTAIYKIAEKSFSIVGF